MLRRLDKWILYLVERTRKTGISSFWLESLSGIWCHSPMLGQKRSRLCGSKSRGSCGDSQVKSGDRNTDLEFRREVLLKKQLLESCNSYALSTIQQVLIVSSIPMVGWWEPPAQGAGRRRMYCLRRIKLNWSWFSFLLGCHNASNKILPPEKKKKSFVV